METHKIQNLAISPNGFIFDPSTGHSYTANETALFLMKGIGEGKEIPQLVEEIHGAYLIDSTTAEQDVVSLIEHLKSHYLV
jgi:Coenzyme PQQ synthesis protein D (PqqD)